MRCRGNGPDRDNRHPLITATCTYSIDTGDGAGEVCAASTVATGGRGMSSGTARDAILYIPSITEAQAGDALEGAARRIAEALDRQSVACYTVSAVQEQKITEQRAARLVTISRADGGKEVPIADVYEVRYMDALGGGFR